MNDLSNEAKEAMSSEQAEELYHKDYLPKVHRFGTGVMMLVLVLSFLPGVYFSFVEGYHPGRTVIGQAALIMVGIEVFTWILEPLLYFPMIGITGAYISFVAGNITGMRIPAATAAQNAIGAEVGTRKAEFAGVVGIIASVIVNFIILGIVIFFGGYIIDFLPEAVRAGLGYALPSVFGALLVTFIVRLKR